MEEESPTLRDQKALEDKVSEIFKKFATGGYRNRAFLSELWREEHMEYLLKGIGRLPASFSVLDSSRPWLCYWIVQSITLLGETLDPLLQEDLIAFLKRCEICRERVLGFLLRMKDPCGGFRLHEGGEMDVRGCYTAIAVAHLLNILVPPLVHNLGDYIASCQTYEGGIGGEPGSEAHGGYTFCGLAALIIADQVDALDLPSLLNWAAFRQGRVEGGFQGRTNKLVDGCYSFWQGGVFPLLQQNMKQLISQQTSETAIRHEGAEDDADPEAGVTILREAEVFTAEKLFPARRRSSSEQSWPLFNSTALQAYLLLCCQALNGGLIDKPGKSRDYYHTCYCLSGLSTAQHSACRDDRPSPSHVFGPYSNLVKVIDPLLNIHLEHYTEAVAYFQAIAALNTVV